MTKTLLRNLAMTASVMTMGAISAQAQTSDDLNLTYRIDTNHCLGCGAVDIQSEQDLVDYLQETKATLNTNAATPPATAAATTAASQLMANLGTQVVFLDFDAGGLPTFPVCREGALFGIFNDHVYSQAERDAIQARIEHDYQAFNFVFTQTQPAAGEFSTISIGQNDAPLDCSQGSNVSITAAGGLSVLFGQADGIDFANRNKMNTAFADASVWEFLGQFNPGLLTPFGNIDVAGDFGGDVQAAIDFATERQTANTGAHELGHVLGLRHQNSFGAPGDGLPNTGRISPFDFVPVFTGPSNAAETVLHTMASGASVGLGFDGGVNSDRFFSERSATRLTINQDAVRIFRREGWLNNRVPLRQIHVPNTIENGENEEARLDVKAAIVEGSIDAFTETDSYTFWGKENEFLSVELLPVFATGRTFQEGIIGRLRVFQVVAGGPDILIGESNQSFESVFDAEIFDLVMPADGLYRLDIDAPNEFFPADFDGNGTLDPFPLSQAGGGDLLTGTYEVLIFRSNYRLDDFNRQEHEGENRQDWLNRNRQGQRRAPN